jgi:hypothetical protein
MRTTSPPTGNEFAANRPVAPSRERRPVALICGRVSVPAVPAVLALAMAVTAAGFWHLGRGTTFFYDEWDIILRRDFDAGSLLRPHNNHLIAVPVAVYRLLIGAVGIDNYGVVRGLLIGLHLLCAALVYRYASSRVGRVPALLAAGFLLAMGRAWEDLLWGFEMTVVTSVAAALGVLCCLDRGDRKGDAGACVLLLVALASFGFGIPLAAGIGVELIARRAWRRLWLVAVPTGVFGVWYLTHPSSRPPVAGAAEIVEFLLDASSTAVAALTGQGSTWPVFAAVLVAGLGAGLARRSSDSPRLLLVATTLAAYWGLTALARASLVPSHATSSRYLYPAAAILVVGAVEGLRGLRPRLLPVVAVAGLLALSLPGNIQALRDGAWGLRYESALLRASLGALELAPEVDPAFQPDPRQPQVWAGQYLAEVRRHGSAGDDLDELRRARPEAQAFADATSVRLLVPRLEPYDARLPEGDCARTPAPEYAITTELGFGGIVVQAGAAPVELRLRRFAPTFPSEPAATLAANETRRFHIPRDRAPDQWQAQVNGAGATWCPLRSPG